MTHVDEIKARVDIVDLIGEAVPLKKSGKNFSAPCPFHTERTPSFIVFPERQTWHCFGACATGGDIFSFVMRRENAEFGEALRLLAHRAGVELPSPQAARERASRADRLKAIHRAAAISFHNSLMHAPEGAAARDYLEKRGLTRETWEDFRLGYCPQDRKELERHLAAEGFQESEWTAASLLRRRDDGSFTNFFRGRLMIPIMDERSDYLGFGARILPTDASAKENSGPKYINSPQSEIFEKGSILYGIHRAKEAIRKAGLGIIVEGYMDTLMAHQHGFTNVVASMGTALTERQVSALTKLAGRFVLALDPDAAGDEATLRSLEGSWRILDRPGQRGAAQAHLTGPDTIRQPELRVMDLPRGQDPDDLIRTAPQEWERLVEHAVPVVDYVFAAIGTRFDHTTPQGKTAITQRLAPLVHNAASIFEQNSRIKKLADLLKEEENVIRVAIGGARLPARTKRGAKGAAQPHVFIQDARDTLEPYCLATLVRYPEFATLADALTPEHFLDTPNREIFRLVQASIPAELLKEHLDPSIHAELDVLMEYPLQPGSSRDRSRGLEEAAARLERRHLQILAQAAQTHADSGALTLEQASAALEAINAQIRALDTRPRHGDLVSQI